MHCARGFHILLINIWRAGEINKTLQATHRSTAAYIGRLTAMAAAAAAAVAVTSRHHAVYQ